MARTYVTTNDIVLPDGATTLSLDMRKKKEQDELERIKQVYRDSMLNERSTSEKRGMEIR